MEPTRSTCPNCAEMLSEADHFCSHCGQKRIDGRLKLSEIIGQYTAEVITWDTSYLRTIRDLSIRPAQVCSDYVQGRRASYVNPLKYCLTIAALFFVFNAVLGVDLTKPDLGLTVAPPPSSSEEAPSPEKTRFLERLQKGTEFLKKHMNLMVFLTVPLKALALWLLFRRSGRNLAENFVFALYMGGHVYLYLLPLSALAAAFGRVVTPVNPLLEFVLFTWASIGFYECGIGASAVKNILATMFRIVGAGLPIGIVLYWYVVR